MKKRVIFTALGGLLMLGVMITIFVFSNQKGEVSSEQSKSVGDIILEILHIEVPPEKNSDQVEIVGGFTIRSLAHIFLYMLLGFTSYVFCYCGKGLLRAEIFQRRTSAVIAAGAAAAISLLYAGLDELHQMFVGGRSATFRDVGIDAIGFTVVIGLCLAVTLLAERYFGARREKISEKN